MKESTVEEQSVPPFLRPNHIDIVSIEGFLFFFYNQEGKCSIEKVPFRGAPCSDAAGTQKTYKWIMKQVDASLSGRLWDDSQQAPYFNYKVYFTSFIVHQIVAVRVEI